MKTIGERIRARRNELKLSQEDVAAVAGCDRGAVSQWETGATRAIDADYLPPVARLLRVRLEWLMTGKGPPESEGEIDHDAMRLAVKESRAYFAASDIEPTDDEFATMVNQFYRDYMEIRKGHAAAIRPRLTPPK